MGDLERTPHSPNTEISNNDDKNLSSIFCFSFPRISDSVSTTVSTLHIVFILVIATIIFVTSAIQNTGNYPEIFILILISISSLYLCFLIINIYLSRRSKLEDFSNPSKYSYLENSHSDMFYLKIGAGIFSLGILIHSSMLVTFEISFLQNHCISILSLIFEIVVPTFSFVSLIFLIMFSNLVINCKVVVSRFFIMHFIGTWMTIGLYKIISEVRESLHGKYYARSIGCEPPKTLDSLYKNFAPYLYPFIIEFCILKAGILTMIWFRIGKVYPSASLKVNHEIYMDCSGSNRGLLAGFILIAITICFVILSYMLANERDYFQLGLTIDETFELVVFAVISVATIIAFRQTSKLSNSNGHATSTRIDDVLLFIGVPGVLVQCVLCLIPAFSNGTFVVIICSRLAQIIQVFLQTPFIISRQQLCCKTKDFKKKPGREFITFLAVGNISLWIYYALANHNVETFQHTSALYGETAWNILYYLTLPFVMFYRFHSSICLAHIWKHSYSKNHEV